MTKSDYTEAWKKILEPQKYKRFDKEYDGILLSPMDARALEETKPMGHIFGIPVYESPFVKPGEWILLPKQAIIPHRIEFEKPLVGSSVTWAARSYSRIVNGIYDSWRYVYGVDPAIKEPYCWQQYNKEALLKWGARLFDRGLLDNPDIRWEYQKAILLTPAKWWNRLFGRG